MAERSGKVSRLAIDQPDNDRFWFTIQGDETHFNVERAVVGSDRYDKIFAVLLTALVHKNGILFDDTNQSPRWILIYPSE